MEKVLKLVVPKNFEDFGKRVNDHINFIRNIVKVNIKMYKKLKIKI